MASLRILFLLVVLPLTFVACSDDETFGPTTEPTITITPSIQWAGGRVLVSGAGVADAASVVLVDGEPVDATVVAGDTVAITLPNPRLTGTATVEVFRNDLRIAIGFVEVVGSAWPVRILECPPGSCITIPRIQAVAPLYYHGVSTGAGRLLAFFQTGSGGAVGFANLDDPSSLLTQFSQLAADELPGLVAPGPTPDANRWVMDVSSPEDTALPDVWEVNPGLAKVGPLGCLSSGILGGYAIAELPTGDCLVLKHAGFGLPSTLSINGSEPIAGYTSIPWEWTAGCVSFEASSGNVRITLRSLSGFLFCEPFGSRPPDWPVFAADGTLAFSNTRYPLWPKGVSFSPDGQTIWTVGESTGWTLDAWDAETGDLLREFQLPHVTFCVDVMVDPIRPRVFISCFLEKFQHPNSPSLIVYDSEREMIEAVIESVLPPSPFPALPPYELVHSGSSDRVHLVAVWDGTTAPVERGVLVASYDTF